MFGLGTSELIIVGIIAVLLFGSRLPEVARSLGKSMSEFKKGMTDLEREVRSAGSSTSTPRTSSYRELDDDRPPNSAPKFEPPTSEPQPDGAS
jgi:sec-independent protein translocase protein TatA